MAATPQLSEAEIQALVRRSQAGDTEAFGRVYDHYFLPIYRYTAFRVAPEVAEDIVADVFVKTWEKLHQYRAVGQVSFGAWLFRIARHTIIDAYRAHRPVAEIPEDMEDPDRWNRADARMRSGDTLRQVRSAVEALPRRYREVLLLAYVAELPHSEIARVLRLTEGAVRILKFRALRRLEALLPPEVAPERPFPA